VGVQLKKKKSPGISGGAGASFREKRVNEERSKEDSREPIDG